MAPILYIAGPMSGLPDSNYPAFFEAEEKLRGAGYDRILNPARTLCSSGSSWQEYMRAALAMVVQADGLAMLPGSHNSPGARLERTVADHLEIAVQPLEEWLRTPVKHTDPIVKPTGGVIIR